MALSHRGNPICFTVCSINLSFVLTLLRYSINVFSVGSAVLCELKNFSSRALVFKVWVGEMVSIFLQEIKEKISANKTMASSCVIFFII